MNVTVGTGAKMVSTLIWHEFVVLKVSPTFSLPPEMPVLSLKARAFPSPTPIPLVYDTHPHLTNHLGLEIAPFSGHRLGHEQTTCVPFQFPEFYKQTADTR